MRKQKQKRKPLSRSDPLDDSSSHVKILGMTILGLTAVCFAILGILSRERLVAFIPVWSGPNIRHIQLVSAHQPQNTTYSKSTSNSSSTTVSDSNADNNDDNRDNEKDPWPGLAATSDLGNPLLRIGHSFVDRASELLHENWATFLDIYSKRPDRNNICGMRVNHAFGLWITVKQLQPTHIVESGVNAGMSTYLMRNAAPEATIYAIDPSEKPICNQKTRWIDPTGRTIYYTGAKFVDLQQIDWQSLIDQGQVQPNTTLIFQDDHTNGFEHILTYMKFGFRHIVVEDNYRAGQGGSPVDKAGFTPKQMLARVDADTRFFHSLLEVYAEYPPFFPPSLAEKTPIPYHQLYDAFMLPSQSLADVHAPLLRPDLRQKDRDMYEELCRVVDIDPAVGDKYSFFQLYQYVHICYMRLKETASVGPFLASRLEVKVG